MPDAPLMKFEDTAIAFEPKSDQQLKKTHFVFSLMNNPTLVKIGTAMTTFALKVKLPVKGLIKKTLFYQFCGGESIKDCEATIQQLFDYNVKTILDYSAEGQQDEASFDHTMEEALRVADYAKGNPAIPFCVVKLTGLGSRDLMEKIQLGKQLSEDEEQAFERFKNRVDQIAGRAKANGLKFMIDAEETWIQEVIDRVAYDMMLKYNQDAPIVYNTYQFYRHQALPDMKKAYEEITGQGCYFAAKFVRGAYMEKERERAEEKGYQDPIQGNKAATDGDYDKAQEFAVEHIYKYALCSGTHNENSCAKLARLMEEKGLKPDDERIYFSQLLGMSDNISFKLSKNGYNVSKYVHYGPVEKVLPYLFRRAEENTSIAGQSGREFMLVKKEIQRRKAQN
jgi:proline dehydrogenase